MMTLLTVAVRNKLNQWVENGVLRAPRPRKLRLSLTVTVTLSTKYYNCTSLRSHYFAFLYKYLNAYAEETEK